jgi:glycosyltransferase 2 family protein
VEKVIVVTSGKNTYTAWFLRLMGSTLILVLIFRLINFNEFTQALSNIDRYLLIIPIILFFPTQLLSAYRWWVILFGLGKPLPFTNLFRYNIVGQISAMFFPSQLSNDIVKGIQSVRGQNKKELIVLSIILDRLFLLLIIAFFASWGSFHSRILQQVPLLKWIALTLFVITLFSLIIILAWKPMIWRLLEFTSRMSVLSQYRESIINYVYKTPSLDFQTVAWSVILAVILQLSNTIGSLLLSKSMHIDVSLMDWLAINSTVTIAQFIPLTLGGIGIREGAFATMLSLYGITVEQSTAFSLFSFALVLLLLLVIWLCISVMKLNIGKQKE